MVIVAYLPDIAAQIAVMVGMGSYRPVCHSIVLAVPVALTIAALMRWLLHVCWRPSLIVALVSIALHDVLDVLVGHQRLLWWPISARPVSLASREASLSMASEVLLFGGAFLALIAIRWLWERRDSAYRPARSIDRYGRPWRRIWMTRGIAAILFLAAAAAQHVRDHREQLLELARTMINQKQDARALGLLDQAEQWPSAGRPGRIDYARGEAYANMGERAKAELYYQRSYRTDPSYFWTVVDLAAFYASSGEPIDVRRRRVAPYLDRLKTEFAHEPALPRRLAELERKLSDSPTDQVGHAE